MMQAGDLRDRITFQKRAELGQDPSVYLVDEFGRRFVDEMGRVIVAKRGVDLGGEDDPYGNPYAGAWEVMFSVDALMHPLRGTEAVMAARLDGVQPFIVTVRRSPQTKVITTDWRFVYTRDPLRLFNISAIQDAADGRRYFLEMRAQEGVAT